MTVDRDVQVHLVETPVHGRILVRLGSGPTAAGILVGFHGYGENAAIQLERLIAIPGTDGWILASIQGLNRFYRGRSQDTVASWMTREDRDHAIAANIAYVDRAITTVRDHATAGAVPLFFAGFSQGVAMAFRSAVRGSNAADGVIAVGGDVPPELLSASGARFPPALLIRGARDDWYTQAKLEADVRTLQARGVPVSPLVVDAGHEWTPEVSAAAARFLTS